MLFRCQRFCDRVYSVCITCTVHRTVISIEHLAIARAGFFVYILFKISASQNFANYSLDIIIKYILIKKKRSVLPYNGNCDFLSFSCFANCWFVLLYDRNPHQCCHFLYYPAGHILGIFVFLTQRKRHIAIIMGIPNSKKRRKDQPDGLTKKSTMGSRLEPASCK